MKPFWIASLVLAATISLLLLSAQHLKTLVSPLEEQLLLAEQFARAEDWGSAIQLTREVEQALDKEKMYLHITLPHGELDQVYLLLSETLAYLEHQKIGEYSASNQLLMHRLAHLYEMESFTLQNIL